jgi:hypothetical protein
VVAPHAASLPLPTIEYGTQRPGDLEPATSAVPAPVPGYDPAAASEPPLARPAAASASQPLPAIQQAAPPSYHIGDDGPIPADAPGPARYSSAAWVFPAGAPPGQSPPTFSPGQPAGRPLPPVD